MKEFTQRRGPPNEHDIKRRVERIKAAVKREEHTGWRRVFGWFTAPTHWPSFTEGMIVAWVIIHFGFAVVLASAMPEVHPWVAFKAGLTWPVAFFDVAKSRW